MIFPYKNFIFLNIIISFVIAEIYNKIIPKYDKKEFFLDKNLPLILNIISKAINKWAKNLKKSVED